MPNPSIDLIKNIVKKKKKKRERERERGRIYIEGVTNL